MNDYSQEIIRLAHPLKEKHDLKELIDAMGTKKIVMVGEASHGTDEFYEWRQSISQKLITEHGFDFIAVEGDWPPCQEVNEFVHGHGPETEATNVLMKFDRWPTWMWANHQMLDFLDWLRRWNKNNQSQVGFHGLDVYSFYESIDRVLAILRKVDPELAKAAREKYACLDSYRHDERTYARSLFVNPRGCQEEIIGVLNSVLEKRLSFGESSEEFFDLRQNAEIVRNAENYYRTMAFGDHSWNVRDEHMLATLESLMQKYGPDARGIVWAHNTHIGDYRATDMALRGEVNIGGLARDVFGKENVGLIGFGSYEGSVTAAPEWEGEIFSYDVPEAPLGSVEKACHDVIPQVQSENFYMIFSEKKEHCPLIQVRLHRAIGVVYDPDLERRGNWVPSALSIRYDAFIYLNHTHALKPLRSHFDIHKLPETWPFGDRL